MAVTISGAFYNGGGMTLTFPGNEAGGFGAGEDSDPNFANVSLLMNGDGSSIEDASSTNTITLQGQTQISTTTKKYGAGSIAFDGNGDYIEVDGDEALGTGAFTIEMWVYATNVSPSGNYPLISSQGNPGFQLDIGGSAKIRFKDSNSVDIRSSGGAISTNTWTHIAVVREGTGTDQTHLYIDGSLIDSGTCATDYTTNDYYIANKKGGGAGEWLNGFLDDIRVTKGVARYTSAFTPPSEALPTS